LRRESSRGRALGAKIVHGVLKGASVRIGGAPFLVEAGRHAPCHAGKRAADADNGDRECDGVVRLEYGPIMGAAGRLSGAFRAAMPGRALRDRGAGGWRAG